MNYRKLFIAALVLNVALAAAAYWFWRSSRPVPSNPAQAEHPPMEGSTLNTPPEGPAPPLRRLRRCDLPVRQERPAAFHHLQSRACCQRAGVSVGKIQPATSEPELSPGGFLWSRHTVTCGPRAARTMESLGGRYFGTRKGGKAHHGLHVQIASLRLCRRAHGPAQRVRATRNAPLHHRRPIFGLGSGTNLPGRRWQAKTGRCCRDHG